MFDSTVLLDCARDFESSSVGEPDNCESVMLVASNISVYLHQEEDGGESVSESSLSKAWSELGVKSW